LLSSSKSPNIAEFFFKHIVASDYFSIPEESNSFGDELFRAGEYKLASIEYLREYSFTMDDNTKLKLALSYIKNCEYDKGKSVLSEILTSEIPDIRSQAQKLLGFLYMRENNFSSAMFEFLDLKKREENPLGKLELSYWLGWVYLLQFDFQDAEKEFSSVASEHSYDNPFYTSAYILSREIKNNVDEFDYRSPQLARWLSAILPGAGQIYTGNYIDGAISFVINGTFGYLTFSSLLAKKYFQSLVYFYFLFARYYFGSGDNAYRLANEFNKEKKESFVRELITAHLKWQKD
ncbi:MAG: DUF5683 domain-containing protein, partial [bacterium]